MLDIHVRSDDEGLKKRLEIEAKLCHRSLNAQVLHILTRHAYHVEVKPRPKQRVEFFNKEV